MSLKGSIIDDISFKKHKQNLENNLNVEFLNPPQTENGFYIELNLCKYLDLINLIIINNKDKITATITS